MIPKTPNETVLYIKATKNTKNLFIGSDTNVYPTTTSTKTGIYTQYTYFKLKLPGSASQNFFS